MKRLYISASLMVAVAGIASAQCKFGGRALEMIHDYNDRIEEARTGMPRMTRALAPQEIATEYFVMLNDGYSAADIEAAGYEVTLDRGSILLVKADVADLQALAMLDAVLNIEAPAPVLPTMDRSRAAIGADAVQAGTSTLLNNTPFTGKGVVAGIVDIGMDPNHINFLNPDGTNRVKEFYVWTDRAAQQTAYKGDEVANATTGHSSYDHGAHTMGTMAGSYKGPGIYNYMARDLAITDSYTEEAPGNIPYYGLATDSEIVASDITLYNNYIVRGVENVVNYAKADPDNVKRCVINISVGMPQGSRDAASPLNQTLSTFADDAILVFSAGNDGDYKIAVRGEFDDNMTELRTLALPYSRQSDDIVYSGEFWSSDNTPFTLIPCIVDVNTGTVIDKYEFNTNTNGAREYFSGTYYKQNQAYHTSSAVDAAFSPTGYLSMASSVNTSNNRYNVQVSANFKTRTISVADYKLGYIIKAPAGVTVYGYINNPSGIPGAVFGNQLLEGWTDGTADGTISDMACTDGAIIVGSYTSRVRWADLSGATRTPSGMSDMKGSVSSFSAYGRTVDGVTLPHVIAPGAAVISSSNKYYIDENARNKTSQYAAVVKGETRDYYYESQCGTSMATPCVAGTIALMLEAYPQMTSKEALDILRRTSSVDKISNKSKVDEAKYGAGLINVEKAVAEALRQSSVIETVGDAGNNFIVTSEGRAFTATVAGASHLSATLFNIAGSAVAHAQADGDRVTVDASGLASGVYIMRVTSANAVHTRRVLVK